MLETGRAPADAPAPPARGRLRRAGQFLLVLCGTIGGGFSHWFIVWLIAAMHGATGLGNYSVVLAGATPIFIFLGLGLRNVYVSLSGAPRWRHFLRWRVVGLAIALVALAVYCLLAAPYWGIFAGMAFMKVADGLSDIALARLQRQGRFTALGGLTSSNAIATVSVVFLAAQLAAPIGAMLASAGAISLAVGLWAMVMSRPHRSEADVTSPVGWRRLVAAALPLTVSTGLMSLVASLPIWFLEAHSAPQEVGRFTAIAYLIVAANLLGASTQTILITAYRRRLVEDGARTLTRVTAIHTVALAMAGLPALVAVVLWGDPFLRLVYGDGFGAGPLELLAFGATAVLCVLGYVNSTAMLVLNWYRSQLVVTIMTLTGAALPLLLATLLGTSQWVLVAVSSMAVAYFVRYATARLLLSSRRVESHVSRQVLATNP